MQLLIGKIVSLCKETVLPFQVLQDSNRTSLHIQTVKLTSINVSAYSKLPPVRKF